MEISSKGVVPATIETYLKKWTSYLKGKYGNDFYIKKEGVIDNLATGSSAIALDFEAIILFLTKQLNPYTAEDEFQDKLYKLIGLEREQSTFTVVQRTVQGTPNTTATSGSILFKNKTTEDQFKLIDDCQLDENGIGVGSFRAEEFGAIDLPNEAICEIITAPTNINGVYYSIGNNIDIGKEYQSNAEFREEWQAEQSMEKAKTEGGLKKALLPYANKKAQNIKIRMNRNTLKYDDVPLHSANIVINSPYDDETIAKVIFEKVLDGLGLVGNIHQVVADSEGEEEDIYFSRAEDIPVHYQVVVALDEDVYISQVKGTIQNAIKNNNLFYMGDSVVANKSIAFIDAVTGVNYVKSIKVSTDKQTWADVIELSEIQLAQIGDIDVSI